MAFLVTALAPAAAQAAPPPNDNRADAQEVQSIPATVEGTTVEATHEDTEPASNCTPEDGSVWYRITPDAKGRVIIDLTAGGDLDAVTDVYLVRRSQLTPVACGATDENGKLQFDFNTDADQTYLVRVAARQNSVQDSFRIMFRLAEPDATPPGEPLRPGGSTGSLNRILNPSDAYSVQLKSGVTYRFNLASKHCANLYIYAPGTKSFKRKAEKYVGCSGYTEFTPGAGDGGLYTLLVSTYGGRGNNPYRLMADRAGDDDTAPGVFIKNYASVDGQLNANRIDRIDLYRFDVEKKSDLNVSLETDKELRLTVYRARGSRVASGQNEIRTQVKAGRYFALVRAPRGESGAYTLRRVSRTITEIVTTWDGDGVNKAEPDDTVDLGVQIHPGVPGPVAVRLQRFDPVFGWQYVRSYRRRANKKGKAVIHFDPPAVGRWRARTFFLGTRGASPSVSPYAYLRVNEPLDQ